MKVGFIGTGSMGSLLIDTFLRSGALEPCDVMASNRSPGRLMEPEEASSRNYDMLRQHRSRLGERPGVPVCQAFAVQAGNR